jgi:RNA polymerase sigma-70 factor (ECF subfamily)
VGICDKEIFQDIYAKWATALQRFIQSKGVSKEEGADVSQEVFLKAWKSCKKITPEKAKAFLFTAANNLFIDNYRKSQTKQKYQLKAVDNNERKDGQYYLEMKEFQDKLQTTIKTMTDASREVFVMHRFSNMSYKEIAESLSISIKAVEKRMHKALKHLASQNIKIKK